MIGEKPVDCLEAFVIFGDGDIKQLMIFSEFDTHGDVESMRLLSEFSQPVLVRTVFIADPQHLQVGGRIVDFGENKLMNATATGFFEKSLDRQRAVFETEAGVTVEVHGLLDDFKN